MIIADPEGPDSKNTPQQESQGGPSQSVTEPPPPPPPPYAPGPHPQAHHPLLHPHVPIAHHESATRRFWEAFGVALLIWLVFAAITDSVAQIAISSSSSRRWDRLPPIPARLNPSDGAAHWCIDASNWTTYEDYPGWMKGYPMGATTSFSLPIGSNALYLFSRGSYQHGHLNITVEQPESPELLDSALVEVKVGYHSTEALAAAKVCKLSRGVNESGVGVFTPEQAGLLEENEELNFDVKFIVPASSTGSLVRVKKLESNLPNFSQEVGELGDLVHFEEISLESTNFPISAKSIATTVGSFVTTNAALAGSFQADRSLDLITTNACIQGSIRLLSLEHSDRAQNTALNLSTINGAIETDIALGTLSGLGGAFDVNARTFNAPLQMRYTSSPVKSTLHCAGSTTNAPARVALHKEFDGDFEIGSTIIGPVVELQSGGENTDKGRFRIVNHDTLAGRVLGSAHWVDIIFQEEGEKGHVSLTTTNSPAQLVV
ncbi:hypothetical protein HYDPIDRAFT_110137 [Hydnomerulius pinastri MD-312]|nr:hypothetical protein HYDPIDRAFT_110137 [Hydnomerulius pinastri MD-312]